MRRIFTLLAAGPLVALALLPAPGEASGQTKFTVSYWVVGPVGGRVDPRLPITAPVCRNLPNTVAVTGNATNKKVGQAYAVAVTESGKRLYAGRFESPTANAPFLIHGVIPPLHGPAKKLFFTVTLGSRTVGHSAITVVPGNCTYAPP